MKACGALILALMLTATAASHAENIDATPRLIELMEGGYVLKATGELLMKRTLVPQMDQGIFVHSPTDPSCIGAVIVTMDGAVDICRVRDVWTVKARFYRMMRGKAEFVCIRDSLDECHAVH
ncbi:hypothetical protein [Mesorhizobium sp.]|jgi:hypothetical protein|uniref:hypothetical protein n=1 Tax=Mesorhizobium sp. TaxID=1871066 RepID=UPI00356318B2